MPDLSVGGQAVIEGVMMRSKDRVSTAVRIPSGEIVVKTEDYKSLTTRRKIFGLPIIRALSPFLKCLSLVLRR